MHRGFAWSAVAILGLLVLYIFVVHQWAEVLPAVAPARAKDVAIDGKVGAASAIQEAIGFLTTLSLATTAFFAFSISKNFEKKSDMGPSLLLVAIYCAPLAVGSLYAYETYRAIALQLDQDSFYLQILSPLVLYQTRCLIVCVFVSLFAFGLRCYNAPN
jgi:hypothetical protein